MQYDDRNRCPACGQGQYQVTDLIINTKKIRKRQIIYNYPDIIITAHTKCIIEDNQLTGCAFRPVTDRRGQQEQNLYQLIPTHILGPTNSSRMKFAKHRYCEACTRGSVLRSEIVYSAASLIGANDFNYSREYFGFGAYSTPRLIVSSTSRKVFMANKVGVLEYEPIACEEDA